jgi:deoxyribodipyrimidine photo-lyase
MRIGMVWINELTKSLPQIALLAQVDSHNIVPCWLASDKREPSAAAIRPKLKAHLDEFFTEIPPLIAQNSKPSILNMTGIKIYEQVANCYSILECDMSVKEVKWTKPGYLSGIETLQEFINDVRRLALYEQNKNDPNDRAQSGLSPWLHFGQISIQRCMLETRERSARCAEAVEWFFDQGVIRRELAENFCYYDPDYDNVNAAPQWALATLRKHQSDKREALYSLKQLDVADTYDSLWNACQLQMRLDGKMHGYMRMYWAKKILEWTETPEQALEFTIYLNDRYSLDGRDPNGYAGIQWSLMGVHDKPFDERPVHGTVRGMTSQGCRRKFDVDLYVSRFINRRNEL